MKMTPELMEAIKKNDHEKLRKLIEATPELRKSTNKNGNTILLLAIHQSTPEFIQFIIEHGYGSLDEKNDFQQTCAHSATARGDINIVRYIHNLKPEIFHAKDHMGYSCLHFAASGGNVEVLEFLLANNIGILSGKGCGIEEEHGMSPLLCAVMYNKLTMVKHLLKKQGVTLHEKSGKTGETAFQLAAQKNHVEMMTLLTDATLETINKIRLQVQKNRKLQENIELLRNPISGQRVNVDRLIQERRYFSESNATTQNNLLEVSLFDEDQVLTNHTKATVKSQVYQVILPEIIEPADEAVTYNDIQADTKKVSNHLDKSLTVFLKKLQLNPSNENAADELFLEKLKFLVLLANNANITNDYKAYLIDLKIFINRSHAFTDPSKFNKYYQPLLTKIALAEECIKYLAAHIMVLNQTLQIYRTKQMKWSIFLKVIAKTIMHLNTAYILVDKCMKDLIKQSKMLAELEFNADDDLKSSIDHPLYRDLIKFSAEKRAFIKHILTYNVNLGSLHDAQGYSLLHVAIGLHQDNLVEYLLSKPENNIKEMNLLSGEHALSIAAKHGQLAMVILLLKHGAYIDLPFCNGNLKGMTTKQMVNLTHFGINTLPALSAAEKLIQLADENSKDTKVIQECIHVLGEGLNARRIKDGNTALHIAIESSNETLVKVLLDNNASMHIPNANAVYPWQTAMNTKNHYIKATIGFKMLAHVTQNYPLSLYSQDTSLIRYIASIEQQNKAFITSHYEPQVNNVAQIQFELLLQILFKNLMDSVKLCENPQQDELYFEIGCYFAQSYHRAFNPAAAYSILMQVSKGNQEQYKMAQSILYNIALNYDYIFKVLTPSQIGSIIPVQLPPTKIKFDLNEPQVEYENELTLSNKTYALFVLFTHFRESDSRDESGIYDYIAEFTGIPRSGSRLMISPFIGFDIKGIVHLGADAQKALEALYHELLQQEQKLKHEHDTGSAADEFIDDETLLIQYKRLKSGSLNPGESTGARAIQRNYKSKI